MPYAWYSGDRTARLLRGKVQVKCGDVIGIDYYALFPISRGLVVELVGPEMYGQIAGRVQTGDVVTVRVE